jgi:hypothetical protein
MGLDFVGAAFFVLGAEVSFVFGILLSFHELQSYFKRSESACAWVDCGAVVVSDTRENLDGMEKEF